VWIRQSQALRRCHCVACDALLDGGHCDTRIRSANFGDDILVIVDFESLCGIDEEALRASGSV